MLDQYQDDNMSKCSYGQIIVGAAMRSKFLSEEALSMVAALFRVLGEPLRLRLVHELLVGERSVGDLAAAVDGTQPNVSKHLKLLLDVGLVARRRHGAMAYYTIADPLAMELCDLVCARLASRLDAQAKALTPRTARRRRRR
jgi:DNA-binding transcriptional ArsR family regulator